jgi:putative phosphoserine phosphatase/1-acylglycerol-3-phosphate O-acyltransferase
MASINQLLQSIEDSPEGPQIAAIFDFDGTIIAGYSATAFIREQIKRGDLSPRELVELVRAMSNFGLGNLGFSGMMAVNAQFMRGIEEETYHDVGKQLYTKQIARLIYPESRALVDAHLAKGHTVAIISSATPYQVEPAAADLGIDHVLCTQLEVADGKFTGGVVSPTCFGQGKVDAAESLAEKYDADLDDSFFYSDSTDDLQLLERVGHPKALNPSSKLARVAHDKQWPVARFGSRGRPSVTQFIRSVAATSSLVTSFVAGLPILALTGSRRDSQNFSFSLFADTASALIGMDLSVKGEEHLWSQRPAVFVFNHQSKADIIVIAKLIRQDIAGIGKQEIKKETPILGMVLELGGVVFIDRADAKSAIHAMSPLVDAMVKEGKSVVLAPEGTRTVSPRMAPFKKGAFHLAMQAGVPMVPIVIHNAGDVAPKGDFVFRSATVEVEVLPPVDTSDWRVETVAEHVREIRNMFARTLGQPEEKETTAKPKAKTKTKTKTKPRAAVKKKAAAKRKAVAAKKPVAKKTTAKRKVAAKTKAGTAKKATVKPRAKPKAKAKAKAATRTRGRPKTKIKK